MRVDVHQRGIDQMLASDAIRNAIQGIAEKIQARAAQLNAAELVDTGLMTASWRVTTFRGPRGWVARVYNTAKSPEGAPYPLYHEFGFRHHQSGKHIPGKHILARSIDAARL